MKAGILTITTTEEINRWEEIFGGIPALGIALAGFTPNAAYSNGDTLDAHARHYLSHKASNANRKPKETSKYRGSTWKDAAL